jgi:ribonuclease VapC
MIDASALLAIMLDERDAPILVEAIDNATERFTTLPALMETAVRLMKVKDHPAEQVVATIEALLSDAGIEVRGIGSDLLGASVSAHTRFGKGRHPAALNFGDCLAYAAAKHHRTRLIYQGDDFAQTDVNDGLR